MSLFPKNNLFYATFMIFFCTFAIEILLMYSRTTK